MINFKRDFFSIFGLWVEIVILTSIIFGSVFGISKLIAMHTLGYIFLSIILIEFLICFLSYFIYYIGKQVCFLIKDIKNKEIKKD